MKDFWQTRADGSWRSSRPRHRTAELTVWLWSPDAPAMDLRHYDTRPHGLDASYEDIEPDVSTSTATGDRADYRTDAAALRRCAVRTRSCWRGANSPPSRRI